MLFFSFRSRNVRASLAQLPSLVGLHLSYSTEAGESLGQDYESNDRSSLVPRYETTTGLQSVHKHRDNGYISHTIHKMSLSPTIVVCCSDGKLSLFNGVHTEAVVPVSPGYQ